MQIVSPEVAPVMKLICPESASFLFKADGFLVYELEIASRYLAMTRARQLVHEHDFSAQRTHHTGPLRRVPSGHHCDEWVAFHRTDDRQTSSRISTCHFDNRLVWLETAVRFSILDDLKGHTILFRSTRIEIFKFDEKTAAKAVSQSAKFDERCRSNSIKNGG